jgi:hypothetical protein
MAVGGNPVDGQRLPRPGSDPVSASTGVPVLALEFHGVRETADFSFLTEGAGADRIRRVDPVADHVTARLTVATQARLHVRALASPPELVIAYCSCAALGAHIAGMCGAQLVLVDPDALTGRDVRRAFEDLCRTLDYGAPDAEDPVFVTCDEQWEAVLGRCRGRLAAAYGGDEQAYEMVDDVFGRYRGWLRFMDACANSEPADPQGEVTVIARRSLTNLTALLVHPELVRLHRVETRTATLDAPEIQELVLTAVREATETTSARETSP